MTKSWATLEELETVKHSLRTMGPFAEVIELACGRGLWTKELVRIGQSVTAIDASPTDLMLAGPYPVHA
jgi:2-polyprenyl-3-methyl-5-hydroxy-6-metoxy-1,4-benzoquinol methylase